MAAHSGTMSMGSTRWTRSYYIFPRKTITGESARGWLHKRTLEISDCGRTMQFHKFFTEKDYFTFKLKGLHNK